jgi:hypothetical protein
VIAEMSAIHLVCKKVFWKCVKSFVSNYQTLAQKNSTTKVLENNYNESKSCPVSSLQDIYESVRFLDLTVTQICVNPLNSQTILTLIYDSCFNFKFSLGFKFQSVIVGRTSESVIYVSGGVYYL